MRCRSQPSLQSEVVTPLFIKFQLTRSPSTHAVTADIMADREPIEVERIKGQSKLLHEQAKVPRALHELLVVYHRMRTIFNRVINLSIGPNIGSDQRAERSRSF